MADAVLLTVEDHAILKQLVQAVKNRQINFPTQSGSNRNWQPGEDQQAPEVYISRSATTGTGTGTDETGADYDELDLFRVDLSTPTDPILVQIPGLTRRVHELPEDFNLVIRTKQGIWVALPNLRSKARWGKLDDDLVPGGTATVSLWQTTGGGWEGYDEDSGENVTAHAWPGQDGTLAGATGTGTGTDDDGSWVRVVYQNGQWVVDLAVC